MKPSDWREWDWWCENGTHVVKRESQDGHDVQYARTEKMGTVRRFKSWIQASKHVDALNKDNNHD